MGIPPPFLGALRLALTIKNGVIATVTATDTHRAIDAVWRIESPRPVAGLVRIVRDAGLAEDLAQYALVAALEQSFYKTASAGSGTSASVSSLSTDTSTCVRATSM